MGLRVSFCSDRQWVLIPAACINNRNAPATTPNASTLPSQINTSHPRRRYQRAGSG